MMVPFIWMLLSSFKSSSEIVRIPPTLWPEVFTSQAYIDMWTRIPLLLGYRNSLIVSGASTVLVLLTSAMAGFVFSKKKFRLREPIFFLVLSTIMVPFLVLARMTMSNVVYYNWQMAAAVLSIIPVIIVYIVFQRNFVQGIALTGIKA